MRGEEAAHAVLVLRAMRHPHLGVLRVVHRPRLRAAPRGRGQALDLGARETILEPGLDQEHGATAERAQRRGRVELAGIVPGDDLVQPARERRERERGQVEDEPEAVRDRRITARERAVGDHGAHVRALPGECQRDGAAERFAEERDPLSPRLRPRAEPVERGAGVAQLPVAERRGLAIERACRAEVHREQAIAVTAQELPVPPEAAVIARVAREQDHGGRPRPGEEPAVQVVVLAHRNAYALGPAVEVLDSPQVGRNAGEERDPGRAGGEQEQRAREEHHGLPHERTP